MAYHSMAHHAPSQYHYMQRRIPDRELIIELVPNSKGLDLLPDDIIHQARNLLERLSRRGIRLPSHISEDTTPNAPLTDEGLPDYNEITFDYPGATIGIWRQKGDLVLHWTDGFIERQFNLPTDMNAALGCIGEWCGDRELWPISDSQSVLNPLLQNLSVRSDGGMDAERAKITDLVRDCDSIQEIPYDFIEPLLKFLKELKDLQISLPAFLGVATSGDEIVDEVVIDWPGATAGIWRQKGDLMMHWTDGHVEKVFMLPTDLRTSVAWVGKWCKDKGLIFEDFVR